MKKTILPEWGYRLLKPILMPIFKLYYKPKTVNSEAIPLQGPIIFAGNHRHIMDQCMVIISTKRVVHYMAKKEYFDSPFAWFFRFTGVIPVDRSIHDKKAKKSAEEVLKKNGALGIFPEGTRNRTKEPLMPFKMGTVSLAQKTDATIIPFAITGDYLFRKGNLMITFGKPFKVAKNESLEKANDVLKNEILTLLLNEAKK